MTSTDNFQVHPAASIFPKMHRTAYQLLKKDIARNGQHEEIVMLNGQILDGRGRFAACLELGRIPKTREFDGTDPLAFSISKNLHRRHLNESQRALIAAAQAHGKQGGARIKPQTCGLTHAQAAAMFGVSLRQVDKASALRNAVESGRAIPELVERVHEGRERLERATRISRLPLGEQQKVIARSAQRTQQSTSQRWARRLEKAIFHFDSVTRRARELATEVKAKELTADRRKEVVSASLRAAYRLVQFAQRTEQLGRMPFEQPCPICGFDNSDRLVHSGGTENPESEECDTLQSAEV